MIDPTIDIKFQLTKPQEANKEIWNVYEPCVDYLKENIN